MGRWHSAVEEPTPGELKVLQCPHVQCSVGRKVSVRLVQQEVGSTQASMVHDGVVPAARGLLLWSPWGMWSPAAMKLGSPVLEESIQYSTEGRDRKGKSQAESKSFFITHVSRQLILK